MATTVILNVTLAGLVCGVVGAITGMVLQWLDDGGTESDGGWGDRRAWPGPPSSPGPSGGGIRAPPQAQWHDQ